MKESPILFSAPMVRAILDGSKTQTRRVLKVQPLEILTPTEAETLEDVTRTLDGKRAWFALVSRDPNRGSVFRCSHGEVGDRLWVRETWTSAYARGSWGTLFAADGTYEQGKRAHEKGPHYNARNLPPGVLWRPSIFLPRWASRITLEITDVRVERVQEIGADDALAEGCSRTPCSTCDERGCDDCADEGWITERRNYRNLWDSINAKRGFGWETNPWVWVLSFRRVGSR